MKSIFQKELFTMALVSACLSVVAIFFFAFCLRSGAFSGKMTNSVKNGIADPAGSIIVQTTGIKARGSTFPKTGDEFVGPFNSWLNAQTGFGAKGDGVTDDTHALQAAFDAAAKAEKNSTLYLPAGTYLITGTLTMNFHINVSIIGAGPAETIIKWGGVAHGTMMQVNGTAYSKFDRVTWNGNRVADVAVEQSWDGKEAHFDTSNEYADDVFVDVGFGIRGGGLGHGFAETSILRDQFIRNTSAGISLGNFNALDIWVRSSLFQDCATGVTNTRGAGNFKLYHNVFRNSTVADITMYNTGGFSVRGNTSTNSNLFFLSGGTSNPATTIIEGNTVIDPVTTKAISVNNQGPTMFYNNTVRSRSSVNAGPVAAFSANGNAEVFSAGNIFSVASPVSAGANKIEYNDKVVSAASLSKLTEQALPGVEPGFKRKIFEVPAGANAVVIQSIVNEAARVSGSRPVVHFPFGTYNISATISIPANADMQLVGDGYGNQYDSMLVWSGPAPGPIISIIGPNKATLRDLTLKGNAGTTDILITNADKKGSRIFLREVNQSGGQIGMLANRLDHTAVLAYDTQFAGLKKAVSVIGGPLAAAGTAAEGRVIIYSGAESNNAVSNEVSNGGNLTVQDTWYEGGIKSTYVHLSGKGIFTAAGDQISTPRGTNVPSVVVNSFSGKAIFFADDYTDRIAVSGDGSKAKILVLGILAEDNPFIADTSSPKADIQALLNRARDYKSNITRSGSYALPDAGSYDQIFVNDMMAGTMNIDPLTITALPKGVSDIRLYRVMLLNGAKGLDIEAGK